MIRPPIPIPRAPHNFTLSDGNNHNIYDSDQKNQEYYNLLMIIYDNLDWYQLFVSASTKMTIIYHATNRVFQSSVNLTISVIEICAL